MVYFEQFGASLLKVLLWLI